MKNQIISLAFIAIGFASQAQIGIGTTTPFSTLEVNGSMATGLRSFTGATTATIADCNLIFTGSSATTITLPTAAGITGRMYTIKNASANSSVLTVATTASQTIDGTTSQILSNRNQTLSIISNGASWNIVGQALTGGNEFNWLLGGNTVTGITTFGTKSAYDLPFITNDVERMRVFANGSLSVGSDTLDPDSPEILRIDGGSSSTYNLINGVGTRNGYLQFNITNLSNANFASSDIVATANNGSESTVYIDMGINSQGYTSGSSSILNGSNTAYIYATGNHFYIGNGAKDKDLVFFTNSGNTGADGAERMRISNTRITVKRDFLPENDNAFLLGNSTLKWSAVHAQNGTVQTSDKRLKTNIADLNYGLKEILAMHPVRYNWIANPGSENKIGLIAQDVRALVPEVVVGDETKENLGMNYAELVPVLVNAIKEQQKQIDDLKRIVESLKK